LNVTRPDKGWLGLFESSFKRSQNPMALTDDKRKIIEVNGALAQLLGRRPSDIKGHSTWEFVADGPLLSHEEWHNTIARGETIGEVEILRADGGTALVQFAVHPESVTGRQLVLFVGLSMSRWGKHFRRPATDASGTLSVREREVLSMVAHGATSPEIASALHISHNTVRKHVNSAMHKLGARSRAHLVAKALGDGKLAG
jgi:PAS domain S-box-containing protein